MSEQLSEQLHSLRIRLVGVSQVLLFTDFDGTLVPIVQNPDDCHLEPHVREVLTSLSQLENVQVGVISGRKLDDLRPRIGIDGIVYAGNHGIEIDGPGVTFIEPTAEQMRQHVQEAAAVVAPEIRTFKGAWIEDKGLTSTIHYRDVAEEIAPRLIGLIEQLTKPMVESKKIFLRQGKKVLEIRPAVGWDKGVAIRWMASRLTKNGIKPVIIYLGDDVTDEDAFTVLPKEITIRVGHPGETAANYYVDSPAEVHNFLAWLHSSLSAS